MHCAANATRWSARWSARACTTSRDAGTASRRLNATHHIDYLAACGQVHLLHVHYVANSMVTGLDPHLSSVIAPLDDYAVLPIAITVIPEQASNLHAIAMHGHCDPVDGREFLILLGTLATTGTGRPERSFRPGTESEHDRENEESKH